MPQHKKGKRCQSFWIDERDGYILDRIASTMRTNVSTLLRMQVMELTNTYHLTPEDERIIHDRIEAKKRD